MIEMDDVVADPDMTAPKPFTIVRSVGTFVQGGFVTSTFSIETSGPVQPATDKEVKMVPEADIIGGVYSFWSLQAIYTTRGKAVQPSLQGAVPTGTLPGTVFTLPVYPADGVVGELTVNGLLLLPDVDYTRSGATLTLTSKASSGAALYYLWPTDSLTGQAASDILIYGGEQYRVLASRQYPGSAFWKALGTRLSAV